jgi:hypothetical protein
MRLRLLTILLLGILGAVAPTAAQAATYGAGTYSGSITQVVPQHYTGHISFVVTALTLSFGVVCQGLGWVRDRDTIPTFSLGIGRSGGFSYAGTLDRRRMRLSGILKGHKVVGSFFQSFWFGHDFCTMTRSAFFTASR